MRCMLTLSFVETKYKVIFFALDLTVSFSQKEPASKVVSD